MVAEQGLAVGDVGTAGKSLQSEGMKAAGRQGSTGCAVLLEAEGSGGWTGAVSAVRSWSWAGVRVCHDCETIFVS